MTYAAAIVEVAAFNSLGGDAFTRKYTFDLDCGVKVTQNVAQCPPHLVTYAAEMFQVTMSNSLIGDAFTRKYII